MPSEERLQHGGTIGEIGEDTSREIKTEKGGEARRETDRQSLTETDIETDRDR